MCFAGGCITVHNCVNIHNLRYKLSISKCVDIVYECCIGRGLARYWCKVIIALTGGQETGSFSCDSI